MSKSALLIVGLLASCAPSQSFRVVSTLEQSIVVPLTVDTTFGGLTKSGRAFLDAAIGDTVLPLSLDIGSFTTIALTTETLKHVEATFTGRRSYEDAYGTSLHARDYTIPHCKIGSLECAAIEGTELIADGNNSKPKGAGTIGEAFLSAFNLILDYPHHQLVLLKDATLPKSYLDRDWVRIPYTVTNGHVITTTVTRGGKVITLVWDTGASFSVIRPSAIGDTSSETHLVVISDVVAEGKSLGTMSFMTLPFQEPEADAIIGHNFFFDHTIFLDREHKLLCVAN